jgi:phage terminase small subunit
MKDLTQKQTRFVEEYLVDCNATQAAIRAGYSPKGASVRGSELLANRKVSEKVSKCRRVQSERTGVTADRVVSELASIGFSNPGKFIKFLDGTAVLDFSKMTEEDSKSVAEIQQEVYYEKASLGAGRMVRKTRIKFHNKLPALEALAKHTGVYDRDNEYREKEITGAVRSAMREVGSMTPEERRERLGFLRSKTVSDHSKAKFTK